MHILGQLYQTLGACLCFFFTWDLKKEKERYFRYVFIFLLDLLSAQKIGHPIHDLTTARTLFHLSIRVFMGSRLSKSGSFSFVGPII